MLRPLEYAFAYVGLLFMAGAFTMLLTPSDALESPTVRNLGIVIGLLAVAGLLLHPRTVERTFAWYWPILIPCVFALVSSMWSVNPDLTLRRSGALLLTTLFAVWLAERFTPRAIVNLAVAAMLTLCLGSLAIIFAAPELGVHQKGLGNQVHVGAWRGLFGHKNDFGRAIAFAGLIFVVAGLLDPRRWIVCLPGILLAAVLVFGSRSSQAILLLLVPSAIMALVMLMRNLTAQTRAAVIMISACASVVLYFLASTIFADVLLLLGKEESLSGRTTIWSVALAAVPPAYYLGGGGYGAGWELVADRTLAVFGGAFHHAHNGYIDSFISIGAVGVLLALNALALLCLLATRATFSTPLVEIAPVGLAVVVFFLMGNFAASYLLDYNSIYWVMAVASFCALRRLQMVRSGGVDLVGIASRRLQRPQGAVRNTS